MATISFCGCYVSNTEINGAIVRQYLPQVSLKAHAKILSSTARTTLTQIFANPSDQILEEVSYTLPLYDGVSVVGFRCQVGSRLLHSKVKSKEQANANYQEAVASQETAAIMDYSDSQRDIFTLRLGNVPAKEKITVDITYVGELKQDSQIDGIRYILPNSIAPRYGTPMAGSEKLSSASGLPANLQGISITVDVLMEKKSIIRELQSSSHSIHVALGRNSTTAVQDTSFESSQASATLRLSNDSQARLERDFILLVKADGLDDPRALLETHPKFPGQQAVMATLVPKFSLPPTKPEIVFVIDRSGSMNDKIATLQSALKIFLKSLPLGTSFNICSFGNSYSFLWPFSKIYDASSLSDALSFVDSVEANMGGTEMQRAVEATVKNRLPDKDLEVLMLTDGQIWNQDALFTFIRNAAADNTARFFSLAIGDLASHSLVEGIARAGNGFSQSVLNYEELDRKVVRMLKGAITPHIYDYKLEVEYDGNADDEFEVVDTDEPMLDSETKAEENASLPTETTSQQPISLFDANFKEPDTKLGVHPVTDDASLPKISPPKALQAPYKIPPLYPFIRTTVYLLLDPQFSERVPKSLTFSGTSRQGPLKLNIPIGDSVEGETIHQLASRKAVIELEEMHGWLIDAHDDQGNSFNQLHSATKERIATRECQALGIKYQVTGKYCSFVALEHESDNPAIAKEKDVCEVIETGATLPDRTFRKYKIRASRGGTSLKRRSVMAPTLAMACMAPASVHPRQALATQQQQAQASFGGHPSRLLPLRQASARKMGAPMSFFGQSSSERPSEGHFDSNQASVEEIGQASFRPLFGSSSQGPQRMSPSFSGQSSSGGLFGSAHSIPPESSVVSSVHALVALQGFEGNWEWNQEVFSILGDSLSEMKTKVLSILQKADFTSEKEASVLATLLVMGFLKNQREDSRNVWELVYGKAEIWVMGRLTLMGDVGMLIDSRKVEIMSLS
ncbi:hypothetical protein N7462_006989 [Penicillium macrosclerotiorum]|uniref:uncharacterized protein n=1 Tax=Penicillium macrosclerotiorum TaxID=303699 RepID=UPI002547BF0B|nr:uncharacterized protein N7462_006989 [Penicillium macrosclerotiorum]KAJ5678745.1 hypothetical protein N7462_006989 [Penicillium macrosclerotiorum]